MASLFNQLVITADEIKELIGLDPALVNDDANPSNKVERLIYQAQSSISAFVLRNYKRNAVQMYNQILNEEEREHFKMAVALQVKYIMYHGDMGNESVSETEGDMLSKNVLNELAFCRDMVSSKLGGNGGLLNYYFNEMTGR